MALSEHRWHATSTSPFPWEQEALDYLRAQLPDDESWNVWLLKQFIASTGALYELDALVLSPKGLWLIEIKSHPGTLSGDQQTWTFTHEGRARVIDNPIFLTNTKAKSLRTLLESQKGARGKIPFIEALVFCDGINLGCELDDNARAWVCFRDEKGAVQKGKITGIVSALKTGRVLGTNLAGNRDIPQNNIPVILRAIDSIQMDQLWRESGG